MTKNEKLVFTAIVAMEAETQGLAVAIIEAENKLKTLKTSLKSFKAKNYTFGYDKFLRILEETLGNGNEP